jgi:hypothetical protein
VAIIALILIWKSKPDDERRPTTIDYRGTVLVPGAMGLIVLWLQQSSVWGWGGLATWVCIVAGVALMILSIAWELRVPSRFCACRSSATEAFRSRRSCSA